MDKKLIKNYFFSSAYQLLLVITPLITTPYLTRVMGEEILSINTWTANIVQWFVLFGIMGIGNYGNKTIAKVRDDKELLSKTFVEIYSMQFIFMFISLLAYYSYCYLFNIEYFNIALIQGITLIGVMLDIAWFFYGIEDLKKLTIRNIIVKLVGVALIFLLVKSNTDIITFVLINTITGTLGQIIMWAEVRKHISFVKVNLKEIFRHFRGNFALFIPQIAISIYSVLDISMLGALYEDISQVNFYEQAIKLVKMFMFFITSIGSVMIARITYVKENLGEKHINMYLNKTFAIAMYLAIPMMFGVSGVIPNFIAWFLPESYQVVSNMIVAICPIILFISISNVYGVQYMIPIGMSNEFTISVVCGAVVNFIVNLIMIPKYGAYGAIVGTLSAEFIVVFVQYMFVKNKLKFDFKFKNLIVITISSILMYLVTYNLSVLGTNFIINMIQVIAGLMVYVVCLILFKDKFLKEIINKVLKKGS